MSRDARIRHRLSLPPRWPWLDLLGAAVLGVTITAIYAFLYLAVGWR